MKRHYKTILITIALFICGSIAGYLSEGHYRRFIRDLFKFYNGDKIQFTGKNFHLFASNVFVYSGGLFFVLLYILLNRISRFYRTRNFIIAVLISVLSTFGIAYLGSKGFIMECTSCNDGVRVLRYDQIPYDNYFMAALVLSLLFLIIKVFLQKDELSRIWTKEDDGRNLFNHLFKRR